MKRGSKVNYIQGRDRHQKILFPETLDEYIGEDNPVRFIDAFVEQLDLQKLGFQHSALNETGRPPYNPADLLKLYIYGYLNRYLNRIRSSRNLEKEAGRNLELIWLIGKLQPDFKTIADFRKANLGAIKLVCREFAFLCKSTHNSMGRRGNTGENAAENGERAGEVPKAKDAC
jgi:transposase